MGVRNSNTGAKRRTRLGLALAQSAKEILAHLGASCCQPRSM